jgi:hypothetical protein
LVTVLACCPKKFETARNKPNQYPKEGEENGNKPRIFSGEEYF